MKSNLRPAKTTQLKGFDNTPEKEERPESLENSKPLNKEQVQKQLAVEELEKLKDFFLEPYKDEEMDTDYIITKDAGEIAAYILDQIKQLKEGK